MTSNNSIYKIFEMFRNMKSDAVPQPPRSSKSETSRKKPTDSEQQNETNTHSHEPEEILIESDSDKDQREEMPKFKKPFFKNKKSGKSKKENQSNSTVNTQATGNVINIVNSRNVRWGNDYFMGPTNMRPNPYTYTEDDTSNHSEESIKKCNDIKVLLESKIKPDHDYIDYISKNLGRNWHKFFIKLGYTKNRIETVEIDTAKYGVSEARYKLLLDWKNNEDDATLGRLATLLWNEGEQQVVKELALLYKRNNKK